MTTHARTENCDKCGQPHPKCYAHNGRGKPCGHAPTPGLRVCRTHGGAAPQSKAAAARNVETAAATRELARTMREAFGDNIPLVNTTEALLQVFSWKYAEVVALRAKVAGLSEDEMVWGVTREKDGGDDEGTTKEAKPNIWWAMLRSAEDQFFKFGTDLRRTGIEEGRLRLAEQQGNLVADVVKAILARLDLTAAQQTLVGTVVPEEFRRLTAPQEPA